MVRYSPKKILKNPKKPTQKNPKEPKKTHWAGFLKKNPGFFHFSNPDFDGSGAALTLMDPDLNKG